MSYDLMVFDPNAAPAERVEFLAWFTEQTKWSEHHRYDDPKVSSDKLRAWFFDMIKTWPAMNGPHASDDFDNLKIADYSIGTKIIYVGFRWPEAASAYHDMFELAAKHRVGFFDVSADDGDVWMPQADGSFARVHGLSRPGTPRIITIAKIATKKP